MVQLLGLDSQCISSNQIPILGTTAVIHIYLTVDINSRSYAESVSFSFPIFVG